MSHSYFLFLLVKILTHEISIPVQILKLLCSWGSGCYRVDHEAGGTVILEEELTEVVFSSQIAQHCAG